MSSYQPSIRSSPDLSPEIAEALDRFARRRVWLVTLRSLAAALLTLLGTMSLVALCDYLWVLPDAMRWLLSTMAYAVTLAVGLYFCWPARRRRDLVRVARQLESAEPRWSEQLWSAVELADPNHANGSPAFRNWLQRRVARRLETLDVGRLLPIDLIRPWLIAAAILVVIATLLSVVPTIQFGRRMARAMLPGATIERASFIQIEIIEPLPPDRIVAAGDSVGIVAKITDPRGGLTGGDEQTAVSTVHLERRYADGQVQTSEMASRQLEENVYAAILPIGAQPLDYRILAGDGVTSWYRLTPAPRPQVEQFTKRYIYPSYAQLADRVVRDDRGELAALAGTTAEVTMRFDQPVTDAEIRLGAGSIGLSMKSVDQENREFSIKIPIESAQQYQVTAKSVQHSLTTGMGLLYPITPIPDTPPVARWLDKVSRQQLVPALAVIPLAATVADDLPVDQVRHQWRVNGGEIESDTLPVESAETNAIFSWQFDLTSASDQPFSSGDIVESRVVAVDRLGQQGQSPWIEILVAQHGIDPSRRQRLNQFADVVKTTLQWLQQATAWSNRLAELPSHVQQTAERLGQQREAISARLRQLLADTDQPNLVDQLEQIDRVLFETNQAIDQLAAETRLPATSSAVHSQLAELVGAAEDFLRTVASAQLIEAQVADALAARQLASELLAEPQDASPERLDRGRAILNTQFDLMDQQMTRWLDLLIDPAREQLALWHNWADNRTGDVKITPAWLSELDDQLDRWVNDGRLRTALKSSRDSVSKVLQPLSDTIRSLRKLGDAGETRRFAAHRDQLLDAVDAARSRHAAHVWNRPRHLADLGLLHRALKNVTRDGFVAFDHELPGEPLSNLAEACEVITGAYRLEQRHTQLQWLVEQERDPQLDAGTLVGHRNLFEAAIDGIDQTNAAINNSALVAQPDSFQLEARSLQRARQLISQRRVDGEMLTPAAPVIEKIAGDLKDHLQQLEPAVSEARAIIARYVQSVAEIAKAAAQAARRAKQAAEEADTSNLRREFPDAQVQTDELIEALIDFANAQSKTDTRGLEFAQDADVARAEITSAKRAAETAVAAAFDAGNPSAVQALERLAESLSLTAEHFSAVESGEDPSESRRALRDAAQQAAENAKLADHYKRAESLATAARQDAEELRDQLERTARRDQQVREELSEIAAATARASLQSLRQADRDQQRLTRRIEMSDPAFHERSLQQANRVAELTRHLNQLRQIHDKLLTGDAKQSLSESEQQRIERVARMLNQAAAQSVDPAQPHAAIAEATAWIAEKLTSVRESIEEIRGELADTQSDSRRSSQHHRRQAEQWLREARDRTIAALRLRQQQLAGDETASRQAKEIAGELERLQARPIEKLASGDAKREATERLAEQLGAETQQIEAEFAELLQAARQLSPPQIPADAVAALADHQDEIAGEVDRIGNDLRRAAIHQQRVGTSDAAQELAGSAERVKAIANKSAARAATELRRSASEPSSSADAHRRAVETFRQIQIESNRLAELLGEPSGQGSAQSPSEPGSDRGQRLAETLDELDRTLQHDTSQTQPKAGEASQTLEQAIQQHAAQAAQTRAQSSSSQPGSNTRQTPSPEPSRRSGQSIGTNSEEQGELSIDSIDRRGAEWGSLREQRGRDGGPVEADVTAQYRRQIEAYFRAIAGRQQRASPSP